MVPAAAFYRVQVMALPDSAAAAREAARVRRLLGERFVVHVDPVPPLYKVRVGEFPTPGGTGPLISELKQLGYSEAWPVTSSVPAAGS